jgi:hypothetical protein
MGGQLYDRTNGARIIDLSEEQDRPLALDLTKGQGSTLDIYRYRNYDARFDGTDQPLTALDCLKLITKTERDRFALETLGNAFTPFTISILTTPTPILAPNKSPRGYLFMNPSQFLTGATLDTNMFTPAVRGAATYTSASINVQGLRTARFFLDITIAPATLQVNVQSQDPQTGNWATVQTDIFGGVIAAPTTNYATIGEIGVDDFIRLQVVQTGAGANWSITMVNKEAFGAIVSAPGVFLGNGNVTATIGYPILGGQEKRFWLMDNTPLFGIALSPTLLKVFQLQ